MASEFLVKYHAHKIQPAWNSFSLTLPLPPHQVGWEHQTCHCLAKMTASIVSGGTLGDTCEPGHDGESQRKFNPGFSGFEVAPLQAFCESLAWSLPTPCSVLPACVLWNFNWIVNDTEEWHNTRETSKNQSGGVLFLTATKQKTLGSWQVQAMGPA